MENLKKPLLSKATKEEIVEAEIEELMSMCSSLNYEDAKRFISGVVAITDKIIRIGMKEKNELA